MSDRPIRILQIVTQMHRGGLENRLMDIYRSIDRQSVQFDFYTFRKEKCSFDEEIQKHGGVVYYNDPLNVLSLLKSVMRLKHFLSEHKGYRIVHCHMNHWCGFLLLAAKAAGVPVRIAHARTSLEKKTKANIIKNILKFPVNFTATHRFAVSRKAAEWLYGAHALKQTAVTIWPNAINTKLFLFNQQVRERVRDTYHLSEAFVVIHVGNMFPVKNHSFLLKVFVELIRARPNARLLLVGEDHMNGAVQKEAVGFGIEDKIIFLGVRSDVPDLLQAADVFVFPSFYEGFPGAVLEAQAAGLPCILSDSITDEICISDTIKRLSIKSPPEVWAKAINSVQLGTETRRTHQQNQVVHAGFDIDDVAIRYREFYLSMGNGDENE